MTRVGVGIILERHLEKLVATEHFIGERIVVLGDSTVVDYPYLRTVPDNLRRLIRLARYKTSRRTEGVTIGAPGMSALEYYAFADRIVASRPDQVVFPINLASFSNRWRSGFDRRESIGWIPPVGFPTS